MGDFIWSSFGVFQSNSSGNVRIIAKYKHSFVILGMLIKEMYFWTSILIQHVNQEREISKKSYCLGNTFAYVWLNAKNSFRNMFLPMFYGSSSSFTVDPGLNRPEHKRSIKVNGKNLFIRFTKSVDLQIERMFQTKSYPFKTRATSPIIRNTSIQVDSSHLTDNRNSQNKADIKLQLVCKVVRFDRHSLILFQQSNGMVNHPHIHTFFGTRQYVSPCFLNINFLTVQGVCIIHSCRYVLLHFFDNCSWTMMNHHHFGGPSELSNATTKNHTQWHAAIDVCITNKWQKCLSCSLYKKGGCLYYLPFCFLHEIRYDSQLYAIDLFYFWEHDTKQIDLAYWHNTKDKFLNL